MSILNRFVDNALHGFIPKTYTREQVIQKLEIQIGILERQLIMNEYNSKTFREKTELLRDKKQELEEFKNQNA